MSNPDKPDKPTPPGHEDNPGKGRDKEKKEHPVEQPGKDDAPVLPGPGEPKSNR